MANGPHGCFHANGIVILPNILITWKILETYTVYWLLMRSDFPDHVLEHTRTHEMRLGRHQESWETLDGKGCVHRYRHHLTCKSTQCKYSYGLRVQ